jgi:hypothetical protein
VGSAILAYVINSKFMAVLHKPVRDCSQNMPRTDWMSKTLEQGSDIIIHDKLEGFDKDCIIF